MSYGIRKIPSINYHNGINEMTKQLSDHAAAAKAIRAELKRHGVKGRVRASSGSMTSSVNVDLENALPATLEAVKKFAGRYEMGHFDGMTDSYEYSNTNDDLPQVKFVFVNNDYTDDIRADAWAFALAKFADLKGAPADYATARPMSFGGHYSDVWLRRVLNGDLEGFWNDRKPRRRLVLAAQ